jgi:hypothetical protein
VRKECIPERKTSVGTAYAYHTGYMKAKGR